MFAGWIAVSMALIYIGLLFVIATYGDLRANKSKKQFNRPIIYSLALGVYCTALTFYGSVGFVARGSYEVLALYIGPFLFFTLGLPLLRRIIRLAKAERITSAADFIAARYGKSEGVAATASFIAIIATIPYIALQLKAISTGLETLIGPINLPGGIPLFADISILVALSMAAFAILFGTRHVDTAEHQEGLMLAIGVDSVVKLVTFLCIGLFVTYGLFDGVRDLFQEALSQKILREKSLTFSYQKALAMLVVSFFTFILLPRQFHVSVVEHYSEKELRTAKWVFPLYLITINLFVLPIAFAGLILIPNASADIFIIQLPLIFDSLTFALIGFIGGLSSATAMVILASIALSIMVSNDLIMPLVLRRRTVNDYHHIDLGHQLLTIRRFTIFFILILAFLYYRAAAGSEPLVSIGLLSLVCLLQLAPAFFIGLIWKKGNARGAILGMFAGLAVWFYTMLLPAFIEAGFLPLSILYEGPWSLRFLRPTAFFYTQFDPFVHAVFWSISANILVYSVGSLSRRTKSLERLQASLFVPSDLSQTPSLRLWRSEVTLEDLEHTVARYLGDERTKRSFEHYAKERSVQIERSKEADVHFIRFAEQLLASAIGAASSRLVLALLLRKHEASPNTAFKLLDDATSAIQHNRDLLQIALDQVNQGISVFDKDMRLICWNRQYRELLGLPPEFGQVGTSLYSIARYCAVQGTLGRGNVDDLTRSFFERLVLQQKSFHERFYHHHNILEVRTNPMPDGGIVSTFNDITERVEATDALAIANETLEKRVRERTEALTSLNEQLADAKDQAEEANLSKTRFLAAAGHDILQPLNAARLYMTTLIESDKGNENQKLIRNIEASLNSVEEIIGAVLDISRLDAGAMQAQLTSVDLNILLKRLDVEFAPIAAKKGLDLRFITTSVIVHSDPALLKRLIQNLISNAIKYTPHGSILVGVKRMKGRIALRIYDTGIGINEDEQKLIFEEFQRLDAGTRVARGLGLGLSIVKRLSRVLNHRIAINSLPQKGSCFSVIMKPLHGEKPVFIPEKRSALPQLPLSHLTLCCIDNEPDILEGMHALLSKWGCTTLLAHDYESALSLIEEKGFPHFILADYHLDQEFGLDCILKLRKHFDKNFGGILITAERSTSLRQEAEKNKIHFMNKPLKPAALRAILSQIDPAAS